MVWVWALARVITSGSIKVNQNVDDQAILSQVYKIVIYSYLECQFYIINHCVLETFQGEAILPRTI